MKRIRVNNIYKQGGSIVFKPREGINDRAICYIPKEYFKGKEAKAIGCVYLEEKLKPYNKHALEQDFAYNYLEIIIVS